MRKLKDVKVNTHENERQYLGIKIICVEISAIIETWVQNLQAYTDTR
jgi:hypothetical protein